MEVIIENVSMAGFSKIYDAFQKQITGYYVDNKTDTVNVFLSDSSLWKIVTSSWGVYITTEKNNVTITLTYKEFNKIIIQ